MCGTFERSLHKDFIVMQSLTIEMYCVHFVLWVWNDLGNSDLFHIYLPQFPLQPELALSFPVMFTQSYLTIAKPRII